MKKILPYIFTLCLILPNVLQAQYLQETFGKNRIQYKKFNRQQITSQSFEFYFYQGGEPIARKAAEIGEKELEDISETVGYVPSSRIGIFIYNSVADLRQSNVTLDDRDFVTGGQTKFVKLRAEMPYTGTEEGLRKELRRAIAAVIVEDMLYGGTFVSTVKNSLTGDIPDWFTQGIIAWLAEGYDTETDGYVRDKMALGKVRRLSSLTGEEASKIGQSVWEYIARRYGPQAVGNVLNMVRIARSDEKSIVNSLGVPYNYFIKKWKEYYTSEAYTVIGNYTMPTEEQRVESNKKGGHYEAVALSPDGSRYAYAVSRRGRYKVVSAEQTSKKKKTVVRGGYRTNVQRTDDAYPLLAFGSDGTLGAVVLKKGRPLLIESRRSGKKTTKSLPGNFDIVNAFAYAPDGTTIVLSAVRNGQTDLYLLNRASNALEQLTNDRADDPDPVFSQDGRGIIFSSNRADTTDTTAQAVQRFRLFRKNLDSPDAEPEKISALPYDQRMPNVSEDGTVFFLSDEKGIQNLYRLVSADSAAQVSKFQQDVRSYGMHAPSGTLLFSSLYKSRDALYLLTDFDFGASVNPRRTLSRDIADKNANQAAAVSRSERIRRKPTLPAPEKFRNAASAESSVISFIIDPLLGFGLAPEVGVSDMLGNHRFRAGGLLVLSNFKNSSIYGEYKYLGSRIDYRLRYERRGLLLEDNTNRQQYFMNRLELQADYPFSPYLRFGAAPLYTNTRYLNLNYFDFPDVVQHYVGFRTELVFDNTIVKDINIAEGTRAKVRYESNFHTKDPNRSFSSLDILIRDYRNLHRNITLATGLSYGRFFGRAKKLYMLGGVSNWAFNRYNTEGADNPLTYTSQDPTTEDKSDLLFHRFVTPMRGFDYATFYGNEYLLFNAELRFPVTKYLYKGPITSNFLKNLQLIAFTDVGSAWSGPNPFFGNNEEEYIDKDFIIKYKTYNVPLLTGYGLGARTNLFGYYMRFDIAWGAKNLIFQGKPVLYWSFGYDF